jgi:hypothetical protein
LYFTTQAIEWIMGDYEASLKKTSPDTAEAELDALRSGYESARTEYAKIRDAEFAVVSLTAMHSLSVAAFYFLKFPLCLF